MNGKIVMKNCIVFRRQFYPLIFYWSQINIYLQLQKQLRFPSSLSQEYQQVECRLRGPFPHYLVDLPHREDGSRKCTKRHICRRTILRACVCVCWGRVQSARQTRESGSPLRHEAFVNIDWQLRLPGKNSLLMELRPTARTEIDLAKKRQYPVFFPSRGCN